jgi:hypothetical protein
MVFSAVCLWAVACGSQTDTQASQPAAAASSGGQVVTGSVPASGRAAGGEEEGRGDLFEQAGSSAESEAAMSKRLVSRLLGMFQSRTQVGVDKAGNRYFTRVEEVDGASTCSLPCFSLLTRTCF